MATVAEGKPTNGYTSNATGLPGLPGKEKDIHYNSPVKEPDKTMRKIVAETCALMPGTAAVLLQVAHKPVGKGVAAHSSFTKNPIRRGRRTFAYIYVMTFGTPDERRKITDATHFSHAHVKGRDYDADQVEAQLWVAATIYWSLTLGYEDTYGKLDDYTADLMYKESSIMATGLRVPPEMWPKDRKAFQEYWDKWISELEVTDEAKQVSRDVLWPVKFLPWYFKPFFATTGWLQRAVTIEYLPERIRDAFGLRSTKFTQRTFKIFRATNKVIYPLTLRPVRHGFKNYYMFDFRFRIKHNIPL